MVNYSHIIREAMVLMYKPSVIESPSGKSPEKVPRWDLTGIAGCGGGKLVSWLPWMFSGYKSIYRRRKSVRRAMRVPRGWGARLPASWPPRSFLYVHSKSLDHVCSKNNSPEGFIPFGLRLIFLFCGTPK